jgi:hypothetical protein
MTINYKHEKRPDIGKEDRSHSHGHLKSDRLAPRISIPFPLRVRPPSPIRHETQKKNKHQDEDEDEDNERQSKSDGGRTGQNTMFYT